MEGENFFSENIEKPEGLFVYTNSYLSDHPVIASIRAKNREEADRKYEEKVGVKLDREVIAVAEL